MLYSHCQYNLYRTCHHTWVHKLEYCLKLCRTSCICGRIVCTIVFSCTTIFITSLCSATNLWSGFIPLGLFPSSAWSPAVDSFSYIKTCYIHGLSIIIIIVVLKVFELRYYQIICLTDLFCNSLGLSYATTFSLSTPNSKTTMQNHSKQKGTHQWVYIET